MKGEAKRLAPMTKVLSKLEILIGIGVCILALDGVRVLIQLHPYKVGVQPLNIVYGFTALLSCPGVWLLVWVRRLYNRSLFWDIIGLMFVLAVVITAAVALTRVYLQT